MNSPTGNPLATYSYDPLGRRITRTPGGGSATSFYYSSNWQVIDEKTGSSWGNHYVWSPAFVDDMIWREDAGTGDTTYPLTGQYDSRACS